MKKIKKLPKFKSENEEIDFWDKHSVTDYFDMNDAVVINFPNLKPSTETISIRLPNSLYYDIKREANKRDVPYQSFIKIILAEKIDELNFRYSKLNKKYSFFRVMEKKRKYKTK